MPRSATLRARARRFPSSRRWSLRSARCLRRGVRSGSPRSVLAPRSSTTYSSCRRTSASTPGPMRRSRRLLQDFAKALNEDTDYFLGTVVTIPQPNGTLEVADGQQRLATTALLLAAIRDYLEDKNEPIIVQSINGDSRPAPTEQSGRESRGLQLNIDDNDLFKAIVAGDGSDPDAVDTTRPSHDCLVEAYKRGAEASQEDRRDRRREAARRLPRTAGSRSWRTARSSSCSRCPTTPTRTRCSRRSTIGACELAGRSRQEPPVRRGGRAVPGGSDPLVVHAGRARSASTKKTSRSTSCVTRSCCCGATSAQRRSTTPCRHCQGRASPVTFAAHLESLANVYVSTFNPDTNAGTTTRGAHAQPSRSSIC